MFKNAGGTSLNGGYEQSQKACSLAEAQKEAFLQSRELSSLNAMEQIQFARLNRVIMQWHWVCYEQAKALNHLRQAIVHFDKALELGHGQALNIIQHLPIKPAPKKSSCNPFASNKQTKQNSTKNWKQERDYPKIDLSITMSQYHAGLYHILGLETSVNLDKAEQCLQIAAQAGEAKAQYLLGHLYRQRYCANNLTGNSGSEWFEKAAWSNHAGAQFERSSEHWLKQSVLQGYPLAQNAYANMMHANNKYTINEQVAHLLRLAAELENSNAIGSLRRTQSVSALARYTLAMIEKNTELAFSVLPTDDSTQHLFFATDFMLLVNDLDNEESVDCFITTLQQASAASKGRDALIASMIISLDSNMKKGIIIEKQATTMLLNKLIHNADFANIDKAQISPLMQVISNQCRIQHNENLVKKLISLFYRAQCCNLVIDNDLNHQIAHALLYSYTKQGFCLNNAQVTDRQLKVLVCAVEVSPNLAPEEINALLQEPCFLIPHKTNKNAWFQPEQPAGSSMEPTVLTNGPF